MKPTHELCPDCGREIANELDEEIHNTGECSCEHSRALCWRKWNNDLCCPLSPYDIDSPIMVMKRALK